MSAQRSGRSTPSKYEFIPSQPPQMLRVALGFGKELSGLAFLQKPYTNVTLTKVVRECLDMAA